MRRCGYILRLFAASVMLVTTFGYSYAHAAISPPQFGACGAGWYSQDVCKYNQSKITLSGSTYSLSWQGATASGTCDPTNNVNWWASDGGEWYDNGVNTVHYLPTVTKRTNCAMPGFAIYGSTRSKVVGHTYKMDFYFRYQAGSLPVYFTKVSLNGHWNMS